MNREMLFGLGLGVVLLAAYVAIGLLCTSKAWQWSAGVSRRWTRVLMTSFVAVVFFCPGIVAAGHGAGIGPAWLMFASGTFAALPTESKQKMLLFMLGVWFVVFAVALFIDKRKRKT